MPKWQTSPPPTTRPLSAYQTSSTQHLAERFTGEFSFGPVLPVSRTDYQEGIDYLEIYIAFDGDQDDLDARWTLGLPDRIHPQLVELGFPTWPSRRGSTPPNGMTSSKTTKHELGRPHRNSPGPGRGSSIAPNRPAAPGGTEPSSQYHLLRSVPHPSQQQRRHTHRLRFPGPQRSGMGVGLPDHRPPVSTSAASTPACPDSRPKSERWQFSSPACRQEGTKPITRPQAQNPRSQVLQLATETEAAIRAFEAANLNQRRSFAAHLLFRERID